MQIFHQGGLSQVCGGPEVGRRPVFGQAKVDHVLQPHQRDLDHVTLTLQLIMTLKCA